MISTNFSVRFYAKLSDLIKNLHIGLNIGSRYLTRKREQCTGDLEKNVCGRKGGQKRKKMVGVKKKVGMMSRVGEKRILSFIK